jgi:23S rRNA (adenine2503-C2)-methyltransferase
VRILPAPLPSGLPSAFGLLPEELEALGVSNFATLHRVRGWAPHPLGRRYREKLEGHASLELPRVHAAARSKDGSTRLLLEAHDGQRYETVVMPRATRSPRTTLCLSSQIGCAMGCTFCATGSRGIIRNLSAGEIVAQVHVALRETEPLHGDALNLVFMGQGEPLHNLDEVHRAIRVLTDARGLGVAPKRITISTSGLVPQIDRLATLEPRPLLAVSVNHTTDAARSRVMPVNRKYPLAELRAALERFPTPGKERVTLEYVLLANENDTDDDAERLAAFADGLQAHVNLIPLNEHQQTEHARPADDHVSRFADRLMARGLMVFVRDSRGQDVGGACGQLLAAAG